MLRKLLALCSLTVGSGVLAYQLPYRTPSATIDCQNAPQTGRSLPIKCNNLSKKPEVYNTFTDQPQQGTSTQGEIFHTKDDDRIEEGDKDVEIEGRRKRKKGMGGKLLLYMIGATKAIMLYLMIHAVAALAGKALVVAKVALAIATALALKKALEHNEKTSYEIIEHPHHSYIQTHSTSIDYDQHGGGYENTYGYRKRRQVKK